MRKCYVIGISKQLHPHSSVVSILHREAGEVRLKSTWLTGEREAEDGRILNSGENDEPLVRRGEEGEEGKEGRKKRKGRGREGSLEDK